MAVQAIVHAVLLFLAVDVYASKAIPCAYGGSGAAVATGFGAFGVPGAKPSLMPIAFATSGDLVCCSSPIFTAHAHMHITKNNMHAHIYAHAQTHIYKYINTQIQTGILNPDVHLLSPALTHKAIG